MDLSCWINVLRAIYCNVTFTAIWLIYELFTCEHLVLLLIYYLHFSCCVFHI
uniref:Uncharacterized protein n=1 Tax=Arundo donax TaxID=35708 RepID=A0A0A8YEK0_ARUDO